MCEKRKGCLFSDLSYLLVKEILVVVKEEKFPDIEIHDIRLVLMMCNMGQTIYWYYSLVEIVYQ